MSSQQETENTDTVSVVSLISQEYHLPNILGDS